MKKINIFLSLILVLMFVCGGFLPVFSQSITYFQVFNVFLGVYDIKSYKGREGFATRTFERAVALSKHKIVQKKKNLQGKNIVKKKLIKKKKEKIDKNIKLEIADAKKELQAELKKEEHKNAEEKKIYKEYELIPDDQLNKEIRKNPLHIIIRKLTSKVNIRIRKRALLKAFLIEKDKAKDLLIFLRTKDIVLLENIANILAVINYNEAIPFFINRIELEKNKTVLKILYKYLGMFTQFEVEPYLNKKFQSNISEEILEVIVKGLHGRADSSSIDKAHELLKTTKNLSLKLALYHFLAYQGFEKEGCAFARKSLKKTRIAFRNKLLDILVFSKNSNDLKFLDINKRMFYKSKKIMDSYFKAKAFISTLDFKGSKRWSLIESQFLNDNNLLADLALFVAKKWDEESFSWLKKFAANNYLLGEPVFINALYLRDIPLKDAMTKEEKSKKMPDYRATSKELWNITMNSGLLSFNVTDLDVSIYLDDKIISFSENMIVDKVLAGNHILKIVDNKSKEVVWKNFFIRNKERLRILINKQEEMQVVNSLDIKLLPVLMQPFIIGDRRLQQTSYNVKFSYSVFISAYEITNIQYEQFDSYHNQERDHSSSEDMQPVNIVSWYDALDFCNWLSLKEGFIPCYDENNNYIEKSNGYRLLTEAEWEYAAKSGQLKNRYPWGSLLKPGDLYFANYSPKNGDNLDGWRFTSIVGTFVANEFGLFDMAGNVSEWCFDGFDENYYEQLARNKVNIDPCGSRSGSMKVCRGGSWVSREALQCSYREFAHPTEKSNTRGIRICRRINSFKVKISKF